MSASKLRSRSANNQKNTPNSRAKGAKKRARRSARSKQEEAVVDRGNKKANSHKARKKATNSNTSASKAFNPLKSATKNAKRRPHHQDADSGRNAIRSKKTKEPLLGRASTATRDNTKPYFIEVDSEHAGQRVDNFLVARLKGVPKTHIYRIIRKGEVRVNKGRVKQTSRLAEGDSVRIPPIRLTEPNQAVDGARYSFLNKAILYEDDALLVINKPSGMAVHAGSGIKVGVIEALRALRSDIAYLELAHRLDRETSGCLVMAKKSSVLKALNEDFKTNSLKNKRLDKRYLALVKGRWKHGQRRITKPLNTDARRHGERHVVVDEAGSYASSIVTPIDVSPAASLLEVKLLTGRTHQVRVHALSEGHPIAGDSRYGDMAFNKELKQIKLFRLFLHACKLTFTHPISGALVMVDAPLPDDLNVVLEQLSLCTNS